MILFRSLPLLSFFLCSITWCSGPSSVEGRSTPVDVVITWLNDTSPRWQAAFRKYEEVHYLTSQGDITPSRYRDFFILDYVVISCCRHIPWIQTIHIIISDLHDPPNWHLQSTNYCSNITILFHTHSKLLSLTGYKQEDILPTFNSAAIELFIPYIPNLAEYFFYINDDQLVVKPITRDDMFKGERGRLPVFYLGDRRALESPKDYEMCYLYSMKALTRAALEDPRLSHSDIVQARERLFWSLHGPIFFKRDWLKAALRKVGIEVGLTLTHRGRDTHDITYTMSVYPYYLLLYHPRDVYWITVHPFPTPNTSMHQSLGQYINEVTNVELIVSGSDQQIADLRLNHFIGIQDESGPLSHSEFLKLRNQCRDRLAFLLSIPPLPLDG